MEREVGVNDVLEWVRVRVREREPCVNCGRKVLVSGGKVGSRAVAARGDSDRNRRIPGDS